MSNSGNWLNFGKFFILINVELHWPEFLSWQHPWSDEQTYKSMTQLVNIMNNFSGGIMHI